MFQFGNFNLIEYVTFYCFYFLTINILLTLHISRFTKHIRAYQSLPEAGPGPKPKPRFECQISENEKKRKNFAEIDERSDIVITTDRLIKLSKKG